MSLLSRPAFFCFQTPKDPVQAKIPAALINAEQLEAFISRMPALAGVSPGTLSRQILAHLQQTSMTPSATVATASSAATAPSSTRPAPAVTGTTMTPLASTQKSKPRMALANVDPNATPVTGFAVKVSSVHHPMQRIKLTAASPLPSSSSHA